MIPVISIVGTSDCGKTTLLCKIIAQLKDRGYRVATVKHDVHGFDIDRPGKDTWKHSEAGADIVTISSPTKIATIEKVKQEIDLEDIVKGITGVDIILTEGFKSRSMPKIEVMRQEVFETIVSKPEHLLAVASDFKPEVNVPIYHIDDASGLTDFIEKNIIKGGEK